MMRNILKKNYKKYHWSLRAIYLALALLFHDHAVGREGHSTSLVSHRPGDTYMPPSDG